MFEGLSELIKSFSFRSIMKSNILSGSYTYSPIGSGGGGMLSGARGTSPSSMMVSNKFLKTYYIRLQEIKDYEVTELTNTIVGIFKDYITNYINKENDIITLKGATQGNELFKHQTRINKIFKDLKLVDEIKSHLFEIIYNGQYCIKLDYDPVEGKFFKHDLQSPYNVVSVIKNGKIVHHLVTSRDGKIFEVKPLSIIRFGKPDLHLINDIKKDFFNDERDDTLVKNHELVAGTPLYYNIADKVKEHLLKEKVVSLLSIKDLIQPLLLLIRFDKNTSADEANRFVLNTENMINKYSDISSILGANFSINSLIDSLLNNIRVLPDYSSAAGDMNSIDLSKVTNKIQEIRSELDSSREGIAVTSGVPRSLFTGDVTKWEAIKTSEKLNSKINTYINYIRDGLTYTASMFYLMITGTEFNIEDIECNLFTKTPIDYNNALATSEIMSSLITSVSTLIDSTQQAIMNDKLLKPKEFHKWVMSYLKVIDPDILKVSTEEQVKSLVDSMLNAQQAQNADLNGGGY